ncbi:short-chain dehydrogenase/reductase-like protein [Xylariaceae sp. FL1272]|nr:short-chain dehydrogenase/reductase-like protein [Xylariaceae sp. FL1272]
MTTPNHHRNILGSQLHKLTRAIKMSKPWIFISASSRGIGHALTAALLRRTSLPILATARSDLSRVKSSLLDTAFSSAHETSKAIREDTASRLHITHLDVTDESSISAAASKASELFPQSSHHLHLAFCLPGILKPEKSPKQVEYEESLQMLKVNTLGPLMCMKHFGEFLPRKGTDLGVIEELNRAEENENNEDGERPLVLPRHATYLTNSARVGSTSDNGLGGWYTYRASKAGVNSITKTFDLYLQTRSQDKAIAMAYHPGTVKTGLSKEFWGNVQEEKLFTPEFAVKKMLEAVEGRKIEDRGRCWDWKGDEILP